MLRERGETLTSTVAVIEAVQACTIDVDVVGIDDAQTPRFAGSGIGFAELGAGIVEALDWWEGILGTGGWLVVGCFSLDLAYEDVFCVDELVLVERVVLDCRADTDDAMLGRGRCKTKGELMNMLTARCCPFGFLCTARALRIW